MRTTFAFRHRRTCLAVIAALTLASSSAYADNLLVSFPLDTVTEAEIYTAADSNAPEVVQGARGKALKFTGDSAVAKPMKISFEDHPQITITAWVKQDAGARSSRAIFSSGGSTGPRLDVNGGDLAMRAGSKGVKFPRNKLPYDEWVFVAGVADMKKGWVRLHINDGEPYREDSLPTDIKPPGTHNNPKAPDDPEAHFVFVGAAKFSPWSRSTRAMAIDDVRVYGAALSPEQIAQIRLAGPEDVAPGSDLTLDRCAIDRPPLGLDGVDECVDLASDETPSPADETESDSPPLLDTPEAVAEPVFPTDQDLPGDQLEENIATAQNAKPEPDAPVDVIECTPPERDPGAVLSSSGTFPPAFMAALETARSCGLTVTVASLNRRDQWIVSTPDQIAHSENIVGTLRLALKDIEDSGSGLDAGDIAEGGSWMIVSGQTVTNEGAPSNAVNAARQAVSGGKQIVSFDFHPNAATRWIMVDSDNTISGNNYAPKIDTVQAELPITQRQVHQIKFGPGSSWIMLGSDHWFTGEDIGTTILAFLTPSQVAGRRIDHLVFNDTPDAYIAYSAGREPDRPGDDIVAIERRFIPVNNWNSNIWARMQANNLTAVSIAVVRDNQIAWARGYGLRQADDPLSFVDTRTTFDAASVSKPVASAVIMQLVEDGTLSLTDDGVLEDVVPLIRDSGNRQTFRRDMQPETGNLIQLMQHCLGVCYNNRCSGGANEYAVDAPEPTIADMMMGLGAGDAGHSLMRPGTNGAASTYTSANFMLVQALVDVHSDGGFLGHADSMMAGLGMTASTFKAPYPGRNGPDFARGWDGAGVTDVYAYHEMAAASLISTPSDIARFVIAMNEAAQDPNANGPLTKATVDQMIGRDPSIFGNQNYGTCGSTQFGNSTQRFGLGIRFDQTDSGTEFYTHGGVHNGYRTQMFGYPAARSGIVVFMTGASANGTAFFNEVQQRYRSAYGL